MARQPFRKGHDCRLAEERLELLPNILEGACSMAHVDEIARRESVV